MKVWLKYLIGVILGIAFALVLPSQSEQSKALSQFVFDIVIRFGRYTILPLLFFSIVTACFKLRDEKILLKTGVWIFGVIIASTAILMILGVISALIVKLPRIPITIEKASEIKTLDFASLITKLFPFTGFEAVLNGTYLLPCFIFAGLAGAGAADDQTASKHAMNVFDSIRKICYIVTSFFTELLAIGMVAVSFKWTVEFFALQKLKAYTPLIYMLAIDLVIVAIIVYPLILRFVCKGAHPLRVLYASICPLLVGFFSGDTNMTLALNIRHGKESLGIQDKINSVSFPLFSIFARGGASLVTAICFVTILNSYSMLIIEVPTVLWICLMSFLLSFTLGEHASGGAFLMLTVMCTMYGGGFEAGYLLLKDAAPILCAFAAGFDALTAMFGSYIVAVKTHCVEHIELSKFI